MHIESTHNNLAVLAKRTYRSDLYRLVAIGMYESVITRDRLISDKQPTDIRNHFEGRIIIEAVIS